MSLTKWLTGCRDERVAVVMGLELVSDCMVQRKCALQMLVDTLWVCTEGIWPLLVSLLSKFVINLVFLLGWRAYLY